MNYNELLIANSHVHSYMHAYVACCAILVISILVSPVWFKVRVALQICRKTIATYYVCMLIQDVPL